ncbi:MAG: DNA polymerase IV, partial [Clostridia bacterium]|nr:DNA polymerase IV [Clostridia bacterium]
MERKIIHVDMDAFFAAVEQRDNPELRGKPVIIGGRPQSRGVVSTASYEARKYGVHSAMPITEAYRLCPHGIFLPPNHKKYSQVSDQIMAIFSDFTPLVEALSLDEAFLDVTGCERLWGDSRQIGLKIKERIRSELNLTASVGLGPNKFLAKLASDMEKPDGFTVITKENIIEKVWPLSVKKLWGIGAKSAEKLWQLNIKTIGQVAKSDPQVLIKALGSWGLEIYNLANGIDPRPVIPEREAQSIGHETTFSQDIADEDFLIAVLLDLAQDVGWRLRRAGLKGRTVTLKMRYPDFKTITRSHTLAQHINQDDLIYQEAVKLFKANFPKNKSLRLIGITLSNLVNEEQANLQFSLFTEKEDKSQELYKALDKVNSKFGRKTGTRARLLNPNLRHLEGGTNS